MGRELVGAVLKQKWRIDALLGEGGAATVYAATHRNGKRVAVKVLHPHLASIPEVRSRFLREGYLANRVAHPGAVSVLDDDITDDGDVFLLMELLEGETLEDRLEREGTLPEESILAITDALLDVLEAAHAKGIVHRDVKPGNIYLVRTGGLRLLDFGIAGLHEQAAAKSQTFMGVAMGTPAFMPPEQARGRWEMVDARSDLWAVGATMFTMLTGRCMHDAETANESLLLAMTSPALPLSSVWPDASPSFAAIVDRALSFERTDRWPDAQSMRRAVRHASSAYPTEGRERTQTPASACPTEGRERTQTPASACPTEGRERTQTPTLPSTIVSAAAEGHGARSLLSSSRARAVLGTAAGGLLLAIAFVVAFGRGRGDSAARAADTESVSPPPASAELAIVQEPAEPALTVQTVVIDSLPSTAPLPLAVPTAPLAPRRSVPTSVAAPPTSRASPAAAAGAPKFDPLERRH
jgi:serine/threonine-protein kinase